MKTTDAKTLCIAILVLSIVLGAAGGMSAQRSRWQMSQSAEVRLAVRDDEGRHVGYAAVFIVKGPDGQEYRTQRRAAGGGDWLYVFFPEDFRAIPAPGKYSWACVSGSDVIAQGAFEYTGNQQLNAAFIAQSDPGDLQRRARTAKARADMRAIASAVSIYSAHMGALPNSLDDLARVARNHNGQVGGPFLKTVPNPPPGWSAYVYSPTADGRFSVEATGDGTTERIQ